MNAMRAVQKLCGFVALFIFFNHIASANSVVDKDSLTPAQDTILNPIVITGQGNSVRASQSIIKFRVLTGETFKQMAAVNLGDLLGRQSNIRISNDNMLGSSVSLQNLSGQQIKFLVNGMPITGRENGNINLDQINLEDVDRIEIVEGPMSVIYGTDALGGVINVITKKPVLKKTSATAYSYTESIGNINIGASAAQPLGEKAVILGGLARNFFAGIPTGNEERTYLWKPREQWFGNIGYFRESKKATWNFRSDYLHETLQNKGNLVFTPISAYAFDDYFITTRGIHSVNTIFNISPKIRVDMINGVSHYKREKRVYRKDMVSLEQNLIDNVDENTNNLFVNVMARAVFSNRNKGSVNYLAGYDFNYDLAIADRIDGDKLSMGDFAVFAMVDYNFNRYFRVRPGLRVAYNTIFTSPLTPSLNVMWEPNKKWQVRGSYGNGFRAPSLKEQKLLFVDINHNIKGNPSLTPEFSHNIQLGASFKNSHNKVAYSFGASSYYNDIRDMIGLVLIDKAQNLYSYENYGRFQGGGLMLEHKLFYKKLFMEIAAGGMIVRNQFSNQTGKDYYITPDITLSASYDIKKTGIKTALFLKHNGKFVNYIMNEQGAVSEYFSGAMTFMDFTLSKGFFKDKLQVVSGVKNIFNVRNITNINPFNSFHGNGSSMMLSPGRSVFIKISYTL